MKLAISMYSFRRYERDMTHAQAIAFCREEGVGIELLDGYIQKGVDEIREIRQLLRDQAVPLAGFSAGNDFATRDAARRKAELEMVKRAVDWANELGAKHLRMLLGDLKDNEKFTVDEASGWIADGLAASAQYAASTGTGLMLGVENHGKLVGRSEQVKQILLKVNHPQLRAAIDVGNFLCVDEDATAGFMNLLPLVAHIHLKDFKRLPDYAKNCSTSAAGRKMKGAILGEGCVDLPFMFSQLKQRNYAGFMSLEFEGWEDYTYALKKGLDNVRVMLKRLP